METDFFYTGIGKRKTSVAKVFLKNGTGLIQINQKNFEVYFSGLTYEREEIINPLILLKLEKQYDLNIKVNGGGITGQIDAIRLAMSKALSTIKAEFRPILKHNLLLRRDARIKERRKYGLKKARKASQYSKR